MRKQMIALMSVIGMAALLVGCGTRVEVPTGHVGKVLSPSGLEKDLKQPSTFRLPFVAAGANYRLITAEVSDHNKVEHLTVFMPKDNLTLTFDVRGTFRILSDAQHADAIFDRMTPEATKSADTLNITFDRVYTTYAEPGVLQKAREVAAKYTIKELLENRDSISSEMSKSVREELKNTPITVENFGFGDIFPPDVIIKAQEAAKEREIAIQRAEADRLVKMTEAETALQVAKKHQEIDLTEAETQMKVNAKLAEGITPAWISARSLRIMEAMASSPNKVFIMPTEAFQNPAIMMGINSNVMTHHETPVAGHDAPKPETPATAAPAAKPEVKAK